MLGIVAVFFHRIFYGPKLPQPPGELPPEPLPEEPRVVRKEEKI
jgi:hypothetical protein